MLTAALPDRDKAAAGKRGQPPFLAKKGDSRLMGQDAARCMPQRRRFRNRPLREIPSSFAAFS